MKTDNGETAMRKLLLQSQNEVVQGAIPSIKNFIHRERNELKNCPFCNSHIEDRVESIYAELINGLYLVMRWCEAKGIHEFKMKDIRHLLGQINYTRFGNLVHYGGVIYPIKDEKGKRMTGHFGLNMERVREVFANTRAFPVAKKIDMITGETIEETCVFIKDMPSLKEYIDEAGTYHPEAFNINPADVVASRRKVPPVSK